MRGPRTAMKSGPRLPQLEKALAQKRRANTAKNKKIKTNKQTNKQPVVHPPGFPSWAPPGPPRPHRPEGSALCHWPAPATALLLSCPRAPGGPGLLPLRPSPLPAELTAVWTDEPRQTGNRAWAAPSPLSVWSHPESSSHVGSASVPKGTGLHQGWGRGG